LIRFSTLWKEEWRRGLDDAYRHNLDRNIHSKWRGRRGREREREGEGGREGKEGHVTKDILSSLFKYFRHDVGAATAARDDQHGSYDTQRTAVYNFFWKGSGQGLELLQGSPDD
jgi:hypothetical protein